jgi:ATP-dependent Lon protease
VAIEDGATGFSFDRLFGPYLRGAKAVEIEYSYMRSSHQVGNFLRLCELVVRIGSAAKIVLVTKRPGDESSAKLEHIRRSLEGLGIKLDVRFDESIPRIDDACAAPVIEFPIRTPPHRPADRTLATLGV